ncbi:MAG TPA: FtsX-like permease family protein, partial [Thermoleophilaceae bacterium]|nr:FtsX-like permease family protein [Thermoleophilaceae bacterium]
LAKLIDRDGKEIGTGQQPTFGWGIDPNEERFNPLELTEGRWAGGSDQVVIDAGTAKNENYEVGDKIGVSAEGPTRNFTVSGVAKFGSVDSIGGSTFAVFDVPTAQAVLKKEGELDSISLAARQDISDEDLADQARPLLPASAQVKTGAQQGEADAEETNEGLAFITYFLLAFAAIALIVGSFVIFNTLSMTVAQRVRELATLRTLGASRKQVFRSVLLEGFLTGLFAAVVGLFFGLLIAKGLNALFVALGIDLPNAGTVFSLRTVIVSLLVGVGITLLATISPARRATRVAPIAAVREGATLPTGRFASHPVTATAVLAVAAVALAFGLIPDGLPTGLVLLMVGVGCLLLFVGVGLVASRLVRPLAGSLGAPGERIAGTPGRLARENATRNPTRTARTAGALMIGLALVTLVATLGASLKSTDRRALEDQVRSDYVVTSENGYDPITASAGEALADAPGVAVASSVRSDKASSFGSDITVTGVDPSTIGHVYDYRWEKGSDTILLTLGFDGAIVRNAFADDNDLTVGDAFELTTPQGKKTPLIVRGIYDPPAEELDALFGNVTLAQRAFDVHFPRPKDLFVFVDTNDGATPQATAALNEALDPYPGSVVRTKAGWVEERASSLDQILNIFYVLLALSIVVSLFGMVNALALSVFERTRELGMLRAIGLTRRQTRRMVRYESVITALIGAALGLPLGVLLAAVIVRALRSLDVAFSLPIVTIAVFTVVAMIAGTLAAIGPARRASRLNVLKALQYE